MIPKEGPEEHHATPYRLPRTAITASWRPSRVPRSGCRWGSSPAHPAPALGVVERLDRQADSEGTAGLVSASPSAATWSCRSWIAGPPAGDQSRPRCVANVSRVPAVRQSLAGRASFRCCNPTCRRLTVSPDATDARKSVRTRRAAHIHAAAPRGPRYDRGQTVEERSGIDNGIWLCAICASIVDTNADGFTADSLRAWKRAAEFAAKRDSAGSVSR
jgi:hypothetical protein